MMIIDKINRNIEIIYQHLFTHKLGYQQLEKLTWLQDNNLNLLPTLQILSDYFHHLSHTIVHHNTLKADFNIEHQVNLLFDNYQKLRQTHTLLQYPHEQTRLLNLLLQSIRLLSNQAKAIHQNISQLQLNDQSDLSKPDHHLIIQKADKTTFRQATKMALSVTLAMGTWVVSNWPGGLQGLISSFVVGMPKYTFDSKRVAFLRLSGTALGAGVGLLSLTLFHYSIFELLVMIFVFGTLFSYITFNSKRYAYIGLQANVALLLCLVQVGGPPESIAPVLLRLSGILLGIGATFTVSYLLWPQHALPTYQSLLQRVTHQLPCVVKQVISLSSDQSSVDHLLTQINKDITECQQVQSAITDKKSDNKIIQHDTKSLTTLSQLMMLSTNCHAEVDIDKVKALAIRFNIDLQPQIENINQAITAVL